MSLTSKLVEKNRSNIIEAIALLQSLNKLVRIIAIVEQKRASMGFINNFFCFD
jgi:hypothetical protein